jgi:hypothetical protein
MCRKSVRGVLNARSSATLSPRVVAERESQVVQPDLVLRERELLTALVPHVGVHIDGEVQRDVIEIRDARELHRHGVAVRLRRDREEVRREVATERLPVSHQRCEKPRFPVVERDRRIADIEFPQADLEGARRLLRGGGRLLRDVPVRAAVVEDPERDHGPLELDGANDDRVASAIVAPHAPEVEHDVEPVDPGQRVAGKEPLAGDVQVIEPEREVRKIPKQRETGVAPVHARLECRVDRGLHSSDDAVTEQKWQRRQCNEQDDDHRSCAN